MVLFTNTEENKLGQSNTLKETGGCFKLNHGLYNQEM